MEEYRQYRLQFVPLFVAWDVSATYAGQLLALFAEATNLPIEYFAMCPQTGVGASHLKYDFCVWDYMAQGMQPDLGTQDIRQLCLTTVLRFIKALPQACRQPIV